MISDQYMAGLLDGEGYIGLISSNKGSSLTPAIVVSMVCKRPLEMAQNTYGGSLYLVNRGGNRDRHRDCWKLALHSSAEVVICLTKVKPYLIVKEEQASLVIKYIVEGRPKGDRMRWFHEVSKLLNRRGV